MTIHIDLPPEMETFIRRKVSGGLYGDAADVVRDAIRRMQAEDDRARAFGAAVQRGDEELARGEGVPYDDAALTDITAQAIGSMHSGKPMDPDALP